MTKPKSITSTKKVETKIPMPPDPWDSTSEYPLSEIQIGDEVESKHHGAGVMNRFVGGPYPLEINFDGRMLTYSVDGKYFNDDSTFADKKQVLKITKKKPQQAEGE